MEIDSRYETNEDRIARRSNPELKAKNLITKHRQKFHFQGTDPFLRHQSTILYFSDGSSLMIPQVVLVESVNGKL